MRIFLITAMLLALAQLCAGAPRPKAPFRVLYDNDSTNLTSCISPWRRGGEITPRQLRGLVDEVADTQVDAYLFCCGLGNSPWWPSQAEPDYWQWWQQHMGRTPGPWGRFVMAGGDPVRITLDRARARGMAPFISFRLNDQQGIRAVGYVEGVSAADRLGGANGLHVGRSQCEHEGRGRAGSGLVEHAAGQHGAVNLGCCCRHAQDHETCRPRPHSCSREG